LAQLFPQRRDASTALLELARALANRGLPAALALGECLPGRLQFPLVVGHPLQFCVKPRLPFSPAGCRSGRTERSLAWGNHGSPLSPFIKASNCAAAVCGGAH